MNFEYDGSELDKKGYLLSMYLYVFGHDFAFFGELKDTHAIRTNKRESDALVLLNRPL